MSRGGPDHTARRALRYVYARAASDDLAERCRRRQQDGRRLYRVRFLPTPRWPEYPWAVVAYPYTMKEEVDHVNVPTCCKPLVGVQLDQGAPCGACKGTGHQPGNEAKPCGSCYGTGEEDS